MRPFDRVAIVGVGLIGGSVGMALRKRRLATEVVGVGRRESSLLRALELGAVDRVTTSLQEGAGQAELVIVCTPVDGIVPTVRCLAALSPRGRLITDVGSVKGPIVVGAERAILRASRPAGGSPRKAAGEKDTQHEAKRPRFVGSHPLAGDHRTGPDSARSDLFEGRTVVVTPTSRTADHDLQTVRRLWQSLGAEVVSMTPAAHDRALAATSHVPHIAASALAAATPKSCLPLVARGWLDSTRIAAGESRLWREILSANRRNIVAQLLRLERTLTAFREALDQEDFERLESLLTEAKRIRDALGS